MSRLKVFIFCLWTSVIAMFVIINSLLMNFPEKERVEIEIYKVLPIIQSDVDIEEEVFGVIENTDFEPGYYECEPVIDEDIPLDPDTQIAIQDICEDYGICYELVLSIMETESGYDAFATNGKCQGIMQLHTSFHECEDYFDIEQNVEAGCRYLRDLFDEYEDDATVLAVYHGEKDALTKSNMSYYTRTILERSEELERDHGY